MSYELFTDYISEIIKQHSEIQNPHSEIKLSPNKAS